MRIFEIVDKFTGNRRSYEAFNATKNKTEKVWNEKFENLEMRV